MIRSFGVISDLHCHPSSKTPTETFLLSDLLKFPVGMNPVQSLLELVRREGITADMLLAPGDFANKVDLQGLINGWMYVKEIARELKVKMVLSAVGNHDVDSRNLYKKGPFFQVRGLGDDFPFHAVDQADNSDVFNREKDEYWSKGFALIHHLDVSVLVLNTVLRHNTEQDAKRGLIDEVQIDGLIRKLDTSTLNEHRIALLHHHPIVYEDFGLVEEDTLVNRGRLLELLTRHGFKIVIHGHKHRPRIQYAQGGADPLTVFAAGSFSAFCPALSITRNLFHIVTLESNIVRNCSKQGTVTSWEFNLGNGWNKPNTQSANIPAVAGFGCHALPNDLAIRTAEMCRRSGLPLDWSEITREIPELTYCIPSDRALYGRILREEHGVEVKPNSEDPGYVGTPIDGRKSK